jgi:regulatory protein
MAGRRARTGRGWDAAPARPRRAASSTGASRGVRQDETSDDDRRPAPDFDPYEQAREICLRQLSVRPRTRAELATALRKRGVDDEVATTVLNRYDEVGLIDDAAFARAWVSSRHHGKGLARRALANELRQRGVEQEFVAAALDDLDGDTEAATARALVDRKLRSMGSAAPDAVFRRLVSMLARKGYPPGVAISAVKDALAAQAESAEFADQLDVDALADSDTSGTE